MARALRCPACHKLLAARILIVNDVKTIMLYCPDDDAKSHAMATAEEAFEDLIARHRPTVKSS